MSFEKDRIALITEQIYPYYKGGAEQVMFDYAKIIARNYNLTVYTSFDKGIAQKALTDVEFNYISKKIKKSNREGNHSLTGILSFSIDTLLHGRKIKNFNVVLLDSVHYFYPLIFLRYLKKKNKKVVTIFHEAWYEYRKTGVLHFLLSSLISLSIKRLTRYSCAIISISEPTTRSLINNYNVKEDMVFTIPLGIDYDYVRNHITFKNLRERKYDVAFVGRFAKIKRVSDLVDSIAIVAKRRRPINVGLVGDGPMMGLIEKKILDLELNDSVKILGFLDENSKYEVLNNSKIFVLPSEREGFSISTLEAMAMGCIPIVSRPKYDEVFGVSHFVKNNENGIYYTCGNVEELADGISRLLENQGFLERLSSMAIETARLYSKNTMAQRINYALGILASDVKR